MPEKTLKQLRLVKGLSTVCASCQKKDDTRTFEHVKQSHSHKLAAGICSHSAIRALARSATNIGWKGLARCCHSRSPRSGLCAGQSIFYHAKLTKPFLYGLCEQGDLPHGVRLYGLNALMHIIQKHLKTLYLNMACVDVFWGWNILLMFHWYHYQNPDEYCEENLYTNAA